MNSLFVTGAIIYFWSGFYHIFVKEGRVRLYSRPSVRLSTGIHHGVFSVGWLSTGTDYPEDNPNSFSRDDELNVMFIH